MSNELVLHGRGSAVCGCTCFTLGLCCRYACTIKHEILPQVPQRQALDTISGCVETGPSAVQMLSSPPLQTQQLQRGFPSVFSGARCHTSDQPSNTHTPIQGAPGVQECAQLQSRGVEKFRRSIPYYPSTGRVVEASLRKCHALRADFPLCVWQWRRETQLSAALGMCCA